MHFLESNRAQLVAPALYGHHRFDFVAAQTGGQAVRVRPGQQRDTIVMAGRCRDRASPVAPPARTSGTGVWTP
eukprot:10590930-Lingulodinium_polyedra.AAC.1